MEGENRNKAKWYVVSYSDSKKPAIVVHGWTAVLKARRRSKSKTTIRGFHTERMAHRYRKKYIVGSVTFQKEEKPQITGLKARSL